MGIQDYLKKFFLTENDLQLIENAGQQISPYMPRVLDQFYDWMQQRGWFKDFFHSQAAMERVKQMQVKHWEIFWKGAITQEYLASRERIGTTHARINLPLDVYFEGVLIFNQLWEQLMIEINIYTPNLYSIYRRLTDLDVSIIVKTYSDAYNKMLSDTIEMQNQSLQQMSTPIAQLWERILFLPLVGTLDSKRAQTVMNTMLEKITSTESRVFVLDISGITVMDTAVANHLIKMTKATRLMGCSCVISGVSSHVAQTIIDLGIHTDEVNTTNTLKDALVSAFKTIGSKKIIKQMKE